MIQILLYVSLAINLIQAILLIVLKVQNINKNHYANKLDALKVKQAVEKDKTESIFRGENGLFSYEAFKKNNVKDNASKK